MAMPLFSASKSPAPLIDAIRFAAAAHGGQERKYTGEPYISRRLAVANRVAEVLSDVELVMAALLHDTDEDTHVTVGDIKARFDWCPSRFVVELTEINRLGDGSRAAQGPRVFALRRDLARDAEREGGGPDRRLPVDPGARRCRRALFRRKAKGAYQARSRAGARCLWLWDWKGRHRPRRP